MHVRLSKCNISLLFLVCDSCKGLFKNLCQNMCNNIRPNLSQYKGTNALVEQVEAPDSNKNYELCTQKKNEVTE